MTIRPSLSITGHREIYGREPHPGLMGVASLMAALAPVKTRLWYLDLCQGDLPVLAFGTRINLQEIPSVWSTRPQTGRAVKLRLLWWCVEIRVFKVSYCLDPQTSQ